MKITLLIRSLDRGGTERQVVTLAKRMHQRGHSVAVAVFYPGGPLEKELRGTGVAIKSLNKRGRWDTFGFLSRLVQLMREERPDVLHGFIYTPNILAVLLKPLFPSTRIVWGVRYSIIDLDYYGWLAHVCFRAERRLSRFADLIILNSRAGLDQALANGFSKDKMMVIPNGIDTEHFRPNPQARQRIRREWDVAEDQELIGLVGRLNPMKDHPTFLRAAALLARERADVRFVCVGDGPAAYQQELHELGRELGLARCLIWAGARGDMPAVYNALDVATSSSYGEGFPNVIGEAMACGVPCVVTDVGDSAWIVGETGVVVPPKDPTSLALGWNEMIIRLHEERISLANDASLRITEEFGLGTLYKRTFEALSSL